MADDFRVPANVNIAKNQIPVRFESLEGEAKWRGVLNFEHATLCRAFGLDPATFYFDLPSSCRGIGSSMSGFGGNRGRRIINGYVMRAGQTEPFGKLTVCFESEKFRDVDPTDKREFYKL
jgi:hypothetical protein